MMPPVKEPSVQSANASASVGRVIGAFAPWVLGGVILVPAGHAALPLAVVWGLQFFRPVFTTVDVLTASALDLLLGFSVHLAVVTTACAILLCTKRRASHFFTFLTFGLLGAGIVQSMLAPQTRYSQNVLVPTTVFFFFGWGVSFVLCVWLALSWVAQKNGCRRQP